MAQQHSALQNLRSTCDLNYSLTSFRKLAAWAKKTLIPFDPAHLEFPNCGDIHRCLFQVDYSHPSGLPVLLFESNVVRTAYLRSLVRLSHHLFVADLRRLKRVPAPDRACDVEQLTDHSHRAATDHFGKTKGRLRTASEGHPVPAAGERARAFHVTAPRQAASAD
jgi:hypothetical protein